MEGAPEREREREKISNKIIQEVFPEQDDMSFPNERGRQVPNTVDENRPRTVTGRFLNTRYH